MGDQTRHDFIEGLKRIITGAVKSSMDAHGGQIDATSVAKRVAGELWSRTRPEHYSDTGDWVKAIRGQLGLTQNELAEVIGCSQVTVARWETGDRKPRSNYREQLQKLAQQVPVSGVR